MKAALNRTNTIVVQPTGNGKSLCYQFLPFATGGTAVVISPTLSLIHDQVEELCAKGITATYLCSTQNDTSIPAAISRGEFKVVYVTPERMFPGGGCEPNPLKFTELHALPLATRCYVLLHGPITVENIPDKYRNLWSINNPNPLAAPSGCTLWLRVVYGP